MISENHLHLFEKSFAWMKGGIYLFGKYESLVGHETQNRILAEGLSLAECDECQGGRMMKFCCVESKSDIQ